MNKISTGDNATLGNYRKLTSLFFGETSKPTKFLDDKIKESPNEENEEVLAPESQMMFIFAELIK